MRRKMAMADRCRSDRQGAMRVGAKLSTACVIAIVAATGAKARSVSELVPPEAVDAETRAMILGPLQAELTATPSAARLDLQPRNPAYALRWNPAPSVFATNSQTPRPAALRFADSMLTARTDAITRDGLSAFSESSAVVASTATGQLSVSVFDSQAPGLARLAYDPDYAEAVGQALSPDVIEHHQRMALNYEASFNAAGGFDGLDVGVSPRAGVSIGDDGSAAQAGATVRLGQYIDLDGADRPAWWFFAGADRQAVLYDPGQGFDVRDALAMQPYALVGDAQAGVAVRMGGADVSLAYIHRETRYSMPQQGWETTEGFAAFSLTWKR